MLGQGAEVRDLLLDDALILEPVTWGNETDGYADAYAALAGFAYGARIENCGAVGQVYVREPVETGCGS